MPRPHRSTRNRRAGLFLLLVVLAPVVMAAPSSASPIDDKRAQASRLESQLEEQGRQVSILAERYNRARLHVTAVEGTLARAQADYARAEESMASVRGRLTQAATLAYVQGGSSPLLAAFAVREGGSAGEVVVRRQYLRLTADDQRQVMGELKAVREDIASRRTQLEAARRTARSAAADADARRREAASAQDRQRRTLAGVKGDLAQMVAAEQARREADIARRIRAIPGSPGGLGLPPLIGVPASGRAALAVAEARRQLGKPYVYGASGPGSFDCSGLTSYAWRAAGVNLSHSAYSQWFETTRVPLSQLQPGDLLFFGPSVSGIHHNAMYIGGGQMIEASRTGTPIRVRDWRSADLVGAGRPR